MSCEVTYKGEKKPKDEFIKDLIGHLDLSNEDIERNKNYLKAINYESIQKQSARKVDVQPTPGNGEKVGEGNTEPKSTSEKSEEKPQEKGDVKKTILTKRAYEGTVSDDVKKYLEEKGLTRQSYSRDERSKQASAFIDKFGDDAAFRAVEAKDIEGGLATAILAQLHIKNSTAVEDLPEGSDEREEMAKKGADIIALMEKTGYYAGEYIGQLAHEYQNQGMNFASIKRQVEKITKKSITPEQEKKIKEITGENERLKKQLAESEAKLIEETEKAFKAGVEEVKNETKTQRAKRIADKIRSAKIHRPGIFSAATPASVAWDAAVEITAKSVEAGGKVADAIQDGLEHIRSTDWYKSLSKSKKDEAEKEFKRAHNDTAGSTDLEDLQERFLDKKGNKFTPSEARDIWGYMKKTYLDNGSNYRDALGKVSTDLGLTYRQVSEAVVSPKLKRMSEDMWVKNAQYARHRSAIKNWIDEQNALPLMKAWKQLSGKLRGVATFGHGHIFLGTHAAMTTFFRPSVWNKTIPAFLRGFKLAYGSEAYYSRAMEELKHSDNYLIAQRAGLKNDPDRINVEEFQKSQQYLGKLGHIGERGFNTIKILRQHLFDYEYNRFSPEQRDNPKVLQEIASLANNATGATNLKLPKWVNEVSFAGGMEAARWEKLTKNPAKALNTAYKAIFDPENATTEEKVFAKVWSRWVGEQVATYTTFLLANAALQNYINPKNPVNFTDPTKPDWLKYKAGDKTIDPTSGMRSTFQFMVKLATIPLESQKDLHNEKRYPLLGKDIVEYGRGKLAPAYSTAVDFLSGQDFGGNIMPTSSDKVPRGKHKVTWLEYGWQKAPLPVAEAANAVYSSAKDKGMDEKMINNIWKGVLLGGASLATGVRVGEYDASKKKKNNYSIKDSK